ncbi:thioesterase family protein [Shewanella sp. WXL01]|uniref:Medium/long-chain acyl-CoA thioesterase YigI n=1 Tax=Shewanella maritima TaxID=2520507 RepID=A0A411PHZ7_9GAMM|nr:MULTISPECIES: thioesterase family protein [Shewanella]NKF52247.1 thioesterase family protein [Shewanella sp. WXL01]QBF83237.1 thioesterase family protein [Shewanella maritima]
MTTSVQNIALQQVAEIFDQHIPFHNHLGLNIKHYDISGVEVEIIMKQELIGNIHHSILHGGVTATVLDVVGGLTAFAGLVASRDDWSVEELQQRLTTLGTIDLRVDYLRPGRGQIFTGTGSVIRAGNRVSVCRMELHNEQGTHIAFGTGTYMVG